MLFKWFKEFPVRIAKAKLLMNYGGEQDDWSSNVVGFSLNSLGCKSNKNMSIYMRGESKINVSTIDELCSWLLGCEYISYDELHRTTVDWENPLVFEGTRKGNCVDFSLWSWRKLIELGFHVEFFVGEWERDGEKNQHAWIVFSENGKEYLINTVSKKRIGMNSELDAVRHLYTPWASIDNSFKCRLYGGYCEAIKRENNWVF